MPKTTILQILSNEIDELGDVLIREYEAVGKNYQLHKYELVLLYGGRFSEAVYMALSRLVLGKNTTEVNFNSMQQELQQTSSKDHDESLRIHIPRVAKCIYDFRSRKDAAHLKLKASSNYIDASFVSMACQWIISELLRLLSKRDPDWTHKIINSLIDRTPSIIEQFEDKIVILSEGLSAFASVLIVLYYRYPEPVTTDDLVDNLSDFTRANIVTSLRNAERRKLVYRKEGTAYLTRLGVNYVEKQYIDQFIEKELESNNVV